MVVRQILVIPLSVFLLSSCVLPGLSGPATMPPGLPETIPGGGISQPSILSTPSSLPKPVTFTYAGLDGGIYQVSLSGQKSTIVRADGVLKEAPRWSPDGKHLAYVTSEWTPEKMQSLWVVDVNGANPCRLFGPAKGLRYAWKDGGHAIYVEEAISFRRFPFEEGAIIQSYVIDVQTTAAQPIGGQRESSVMPTESPDGKWAVVPEKTGDKWVLYLLDRQGNKVRVIYEPSSGEMVTGEWAPDSRRLAIFLPREKEIYSYDVYSAKWRKLLSLSTTHGHYPLVTNLRWSPNAEWLSYLLSDQKLVNGICVLHLADNSERCFDTTWISNDYVWSSDSCSIAYVAKDSGETDLFAVNVLDGVLTNLTQDGNSVFEHSIAP